MWFRDQPEPSGIFLYRIKGFAFLALSSPGIPLYLLSPSHSCLGFFLCFWVFFFLFVCIFLARKQTLYQSFSSLCHMLHGFSVPSVQRPKNKNQKQQQETKQNKTVEELQQQQQKTVEEDSFPC